MATMLRGTHATSVLTSKFTSPSSWSMQVDAGAKGLSTATVWEACALAWAGLDDIFVVNSVAPRKGARPGRVGPMHRVLVAVDNATMPPNCPTPLARRDPGLAS